MSPELAPALRVLLRISLCGAACGHAGVTPDHTPAASVAAHPSPYLNECDRLRFVTLSEGFQHRNRVADALISHWTLVGGSGSIFSIHAWRR